MRTTARGVRRVEWQCRPIVLEGRPLKRWHREYVKHNFARREVVLTEAETKRIVRRERREINGLSGKPATYQRSDQYAFNETPPDGIFDIPPDQEVVSRDHGMTPREVWDTLSAKERKEIEEVIRRSDLGWQTGDVTTFRSAWRFSFWSILPRQGDWEGYLRRQAGQWRPWQSEIVSATLQDYIPMAVSTVQYFDAQERRKVLCVTVKVRLVEGEDAWEGKAYYYLRRHLFQYKIVHMEFPFEEIKASPAGDRMLPFGVHSGARRLFTSDCRQGRRRDDCRSSAHGTALLFATRCCP